MGREAGARATRVRQETKKKDRKKSKITKKLTCLATECYQMHWHEAVQKFLNGHTRLQYFYITTTIVRDFHIGIIDSPVLL